MPKLNLKPAFTLIELLVVITIIATLAGAILYSTDNTREKGRDAQRKENLKTINSALISYHVDNGIYPPQVGSVRDFASDSTDPSGWIPDISTYLEKLPKDPQQANSGQVAGSASMTITSGTDDGKRVIELSAPDDFDYSVTDNPVGHPFFCGGSPETRDSFMRFQNVPIPQGATINNATLKFTPRNDSGPGDNSANSSDPSIIKTRFRVELSPNPATITSRTDWDSRAKTAPANAVAWNNIPKWYPSPTASDLTSPDLSSLLQAVVAQGTWNDGNSLIIFWEDNGTGLGSPPNCGGRVPVSFEGQSAGLGNMPQLNITWTTSVPPTTCTDPAATNNGGPLPCTYPPASSDRGACDNKQGVFCLRVSDDKSAYVLWTQLENINDREHFSKSEAICNQNDPDFDPSNTSSPYYGLGRPAGGFLNYCIKSPQ